MRYLCVNAYALSFLGSNSWILWSLWTNDYVSEIASNHICLISLLFHQYILVLLPLNLQGVKYDRLSGISIMLRLGCVLHTASLSASSLIEEEHQTWYFFWTTLLLQALILVKCVFKEVRFI